VNAASVGTQQVAAFFPSLPVKVRIITLISLYDIKGKMCYEKLNDRMIGVELEVLAKNDNVVLVACGEEKVLPFEVASGSREQAFAGLLGFKEEEWQ
jgi:hypothetical protein